MSTFVLEVASPDSARTVEGVTYLDVAAADGRLTVLPGHQPLICALGTGPAVLRTASPAREQLFSLNGGVMTVAPDIVRIVTREAPPV